MIDHKLSEDNKKEICLWHYPKPYDVYDFPPYILLKIFKAGFCDPLEQEEYLGYFENNNLIGFTSLKKEEDHLVVAIGVKPEYCSKGYGYQILKRIDEIRKLKYPSFPIELIVRTWNQRAINCYQKSGYQITGEPFELTVNGSKDLYYRMKKEFT